MARPFIKDEALKKQTLYVGVKNCIVDILGVDECKKIALNALEKEFKKKRHERATKRL